MPTKTKKKRPRRKAAPSSPPRPRPRGKPRPGVGRAAATRAPASLQFKVVELSTVDEGSLERTLNEWTAQGWNLDTVQFAMRESSRRPAMAFVLFTREGPAEAEAPGPHDEEQAHQRLVRLSESGSPTVELMEDHARVHARRPGRFPTSAHERLAQLAGLDEPESPETGLTLEPEE